MSNEQFNNSSDFFLFKPNIFFFLLSISIHITNTYASKWVKVKEKKKDRKKKKKQNKHVEWTETYEKRANQKRNQRPNNNNKRREFKSIRNTIANNRYQIHTFNWKCFTIRSAHITDVLLLITYEGDSGVWNHTVCVCVGLSLANFLLFLIRVRAIVRRTRCRQIVSLEWILFIVWKSLSRWRDDDDASADTHYNCDRSCVCFYTF